MSTVLPGNEFPVTRLSIPVKGRGIRSAAAGIAAAAGLVALFAVAGSPAESSSGVASAGAIRAQADIAKQYTGEGLTAQQSFGVFEADLIAQNAAVSPAAGQENAWVSVARSTCDAMPTWAGEETQVAQQIRAVIGQVSDAQVHAFEVAAGLAYCPAQVGAVG